MKGKLLVGLALASLLLPSQPEPPLRTGAYVQDVTPTSAKVCWVGEPADDVVLDVRAEDAGGAAPEVVWLSAGERRVAQVRGLTPATRYRFAATVGGEVRAELTGSFRTAPARPDAKVRFAVLGDSGGLPWWVNLSRSPLIGALARAELLPPAGAPRRIGARIAAFAPDFWLHTGDVVYPRGEQRHFGPGFFRPFADALRHAPIYPVLGNHDWEHDHGRPLLANFELPEGGDEQFFTFAWGPLRIVGLNCNHSVGLDPALAWLARAFEGTSEPWRIVYEHFPPWSASDQGDRQDLIERLVPALVAAGVDVLFCGHDHNYQRFVPVSGLHVVITGGGGKSLYRLREHPRLVRAASVYHYVEVEADAERLALRAVDLDGAELDAFTIARRPR